MAMNKAEKQHVVDLETELRRAYAFHRTFHVEPDIKPQNLGNARVYGFLVCHTTRVEAAWSTSTNHGFARDKDGMSLPWDDGLFHSASQHGVPLYSRKSDALRELRHRIEEDMLGRLVLVDMGIEEALQQEAGR